MKTIRGLLLILLLMSGLFLLYSCEEKETELSIYSEKTGTSYRLNEGDYVIFEHNSVPINLTVKDDKLYYDIYEKSSTHMLEMNGGYVLGVDCGEFDGWLGLYDYAPSNGNQQIIVQDNCLEIIPLDEYPYDEAIALTGGIFDKPFCVWKITPNENEKRWELWETLEEPNEEGGCWCDVFLYDEDSRMLVYYHDGTGLCTFSFDTGEKTVLSESELMKKDDFRSIAKLGESYYLGGHNGILCYQIETGEEIWYRGVHPDCLYSESDNGK